MVFGFQRKKGKSGSKKKEKNSKSRSIPPSSLMTQTTEKILEKEQVAELLLLEDRVDKNLANDAEYTKICAFYMVGTPGPADRSDSSSSST